MQLYRLLFILLISFNLKAQSTHYAEEFEKKRYEQYRTGMMYGYSYNNGSCIDLGTYVYGRLGTLKSDYQSGSYHTFMLSYNFNESALNKLMLKIDWSMGEDYNSSRGYVNNFFYIKPGIMIYSDFENLFITPRLGIKFDANNILHISSFVNYIDNRPFFGIDAYISIKRLSSLYLDH